MTDSYLHAVMRQVNEPDTLVVDHISIPLSAFYHRQLDIFNIATF